MYRYETGSIIELLDIGVHVDKVPPGCSHPSEVRNVTQTHGRAPCHDDLGRGDEPEDGRHGAR
jgi:hypothetical protein